jgi:hypothetical protein
MTLLCMNDDRMLIRIYWARYNLGSHPHPFISLEYSQTVRVLLPNSQLTLSIEIFIIERLNPKVGVRMVDGLQEA